MFGSYRTFVQKEILWTFNICRFPSHVTQINYQSYGFWRKCISCRQNLLWVHCSNAILQISIWFCFLSHDVLASENEYHFLLCLVHCFCISSNILNERLICHYCWICNRLYRRVSYVPANKMVNTQIDS